MRGRVGAGRAPVQGGTPTQKGAGDGRAAAEPKKPKRSPAQAEPNAQEAEALLHARGDCAHNRVRARGLHLVIEHGEGDDGVARLTPLGGQTFGASFRTHTGRWEPMPVSGPLQDVVPELVNVLGPYLDRDTFSLGTCGTGR
jgi:hypothetical protein